MAEHTGFRVRPKVTVALALLALAMIFILQNTHRINIHFLGLESSAPTALMIFIILVVGIVIGWGLSSYHRRVRK